MGEGARMHHRVRQLMLSLAGVPVLQGVERILAALGLLFVIFSTYTGLRSLLLQPARQSGYEFIDFFNRSLGILAIYASIPHIILFDDLSVLHDANKTFGLGLDLHALDLSPGYEINNLDANNPSSLPWSHSPEGLYIPDGKFVADDTFLSDTLCEHIYNTPYEDLASGRIPHEDPHEYPSGEYMMDGKPSLCYIEKSFKYYGESKAEVCDRIKHLRPEIDSYQRGLERESRLALFFVTFRLWEFGKGLMKLGEHMMECGRSENATECPGPDLSRLVCLFHDTEEDDSWDSASSPSKSKCYITETFSPERFAWDQPFNETAQALLKLVAEGPLLELLPKKSRDAERELLHILSMHRKIFTAYINVTSELLGRARQVKEELGSGLYKEDPFPPADHHGCTAICQQRRVALLVPFLSEIMLPRLHDIVRKTILGLRLAEEAYSRGNSIREEMGELHNGCMFHSMHWVVQVAPENRTCQADCVWDKRIFDDLGNLFQGVQTMYTWAMSVWSMVELKRGRLERQWKEGQDMLLGDEHGCSPLDICLWSKMSLNDSRKNPWSKDAIRLAHFWDCCRDCEEAWYEVHRDRLNQEAREAREAARRVAWKQGWVYRMLKVVGFDM